MSDNRRVSSLLVVTGPPGAGKSSVAQALAEKFERSVLVEGDAFFPPLDRSAWREVERTTVESPEWTPEDTGYSEWVDSIEDDLKTPQTGAQSVTTPNGDYAYHRGTLEQCTRATTTADCPENHLYGPTPEDAF